MFFYKFVYTEDLVMSKSKVYVDFPSKLFFYCLSLVLPPSGTCKIVEIQRRYRTDGT